MKKKFLFVSLLFILAFFCVSVFAEPVDSSSECVLDSVSQELETLNGTDEKTVGAQEKVVTETDSEGVDSDKTQSSDSMSAQKVSAVQTATWIEIKRQFKDF